MISKNSGQFRKLSAPLMNNLPDKYLSLPIEKKVGQMFIVGLPGERLDESTYGLLVGMSPGGVCLFARNTREALKTRLLTDAIRDVMLFEPFICVDQEGGLVDRLRRILEPMPAPRDIASAGGTDDFRTLASITAEALRMLAMNVDFAPVVDVITPQRETFNNGLHSRGLGSDAPSVSENSTAYLGELQAGGVLGCLKHFPGIGAAEVDSHDHLPDVRVSDEVLREIDLAPYTAHFEAGTAHAVMTGHAVFPSASFQETGGDGKPLPSSLSGNIVQGLLRDQLGFKGLSLTDDLEMGAIVENYGIGEACVLAVEAGHDLLLICNSPESVEVGYRAVVNAAIDGRITEDRIDSTLERISAARRLLQPPLEYDPSRMNELSEKLRKLKKRIGG